mmetsp:Transcript_7009/g.15625  ORF Transcript_7009/g.15625 Transcript_7009/m.15625 type:complete len:261 (+) Transcript_7009:620-1402(+)
MTRSSASRLILNGNTRTELMAQSSSSLAVSRELTASKEVDTVLGARRAEAVATSCAASAELDCCVPPRVLSGRDAFGSYARNIDDDTPSMEDEIDVRRELYSAIFVIVPSAFNVRSSVMGDWPASSASTDPATSVCTRQVSMSNISTQTLNVGGPARSKIDFWIPRRRASSSPNVTLTTPPIKSHRAGFFKTFSSVWPCAVPISWTPRSLIVRAAAVSRSVPISSTTIVCGVWFSTASINTKCCSLAIGTCMRLACPTPM